MPDPRVALLLEPATHRLVRTVDAMSDEQWAGPSLLPGWSRAHVVAHVTLNAEGLSAALEGVHDGRRIPMYPSQEHRDAAIATLAEQPVGEIRDRFLASCTVVSGRVGDLAPNLESASIERVTGGSRFLAGQAGEMRVRELEIHHVDLGLAHTTADWDPDFVALLLDARAAVFADPAPGRGFTAYAEDLDRSWTFGDGGPTVSGSGAALAWWTTGRGSGEGLSSDSGTLPQIGAW